MESSCIENLFRTLNPWASKRPVKTELLNSIDFEKLAKVNNKEQMYYKLFGTPVIQNLLFA